MQLNFNNNSLTKLNILQIHLMTLPQMKRGAKLHKV